MVTNIAGKNQRVICDACTRERYGIRNGDEFVIVSLVEKKPEPRPPGPPRKRTKKAVKPNPFHGHAGGAEVL